MQLFYCPEVYNGLFELNAEESRHCIKVLRKEAGDIIHLIDGKGCFYEVKITLASQKKVGFEILNEWRETIRPYKLHIAIAPTKSIDRFEWFLEKATEIGVDEITPILCERSERKIIKTDRLNKILLAATKQSLKASIPVLNEAVPFKDFISELKDEKVYIAHCEPYEKQSLKNFQPSDATICIGPEGDFSIDEIDLALEQGHTAIHLGSSRLRTETAGIVACHTLALQYESK